MYDKKLSWAMWYKKNREKKIAYTLNLLKKTNYATEKTPKQRMIRYIKRRTRAIYPLKNHLCEFCGNKATEHHHNTFPIEIDKFNYCCHNCHRLVENLKTTAKKEVKENV